MNCLGFLRKLPLLLLLVVFLSSCSDEAKPVLDDQDPVVLASTSTALPTLQPATMPTDTPEPKPTQTAAPEQSEIAELLPEGTLTVDVMELGAPPRLEILLAKLQVSIQQDQEWWTAHFELPRSFQTGPGRYKTFPGYKMRYDPFERRG